MWNDGKCEDDPAVAALKIHEAHKANGADEVQWGNYKFSLVPNTIECREPGEKSWLGQSKFETWAGNDEDLTLEAGTLSHEGYIKQVDTGLRIYKAQCPNAIAEKVGGITDIPAGSK